MTKNTEYTGTESGHDPAAPLPAAIPAPGGTTAGAVPPAEPIPDAPDPFSATGDPTLPTPQDREEPQED